MHLTAYVPCRDNRETLEAAILSILAQTRVPEEIVVVDDGSRDGSGEIARRLGARVERLERPSGRGAARARAMEVARGEFVLGCDATNELAPDFAEVAMGRFAGERVAAVCGEIRGRHAGTAAERWRNRHLFKEGSVVEGEGDLLTWGCIVRRSAVMEVGNFDPGLVAAEDADLGARLRAAGWRCVRAPGAVAWSLARNGVGEVLERYARWNCSGRMGAVSLARQVVYAVKVMALADLAAGDAGAAGISLACPWYQWWWSRARGRFRAG